MALPSGFPLPPKPPPASVPLTDAAWFNHHLAVHAWLVRLYAALKE